MRPQRIYSKAGHSLSEVIVAVVVFSLFVTMIGSSTMLFQRLVTDINHQAEFETNIRSSLDVFGKDYRMARKVTFYSDHDISIERLDGRVVDYVMQKSNAGYQLVRSSDGARRVIMRNVHELDFRLSDTDPSVLVVRVAVAKVTAGTTSTRELEVRFLKRRTS